MFDEILEGQIVDFISLEDIQKAKERIGSILTDTKLIKSRIFSQEYNNEVFIKPENLQVTGSFKIRGAYNKIIQIPNEDRQKGIVASSAGNHAQGVAYAAQKLGVKATIVMPKTTPFIKIDATRKYGAKVVLAGNYYDDAFFEARRLEKENGYLFVHPFNDWDIIAGQGTIGLEILEELPDADYIIAPVGGGGLLSGIAIAAKALKPNIKVIGVEPVGANALKLSLDNNALTSVEHVNTIAEGVAVKRPGKLTFTVINKLVDDIIIVTDNDLMESFFLLLEKHKLLAENAGVLSLAALRKLPVKNKKIVSVVSGGNIDVLTISSMIRLGLVTRGRIFCFSVEVPDRPGELYKITKILAEQNANITNMEHDKFKDISRFSKALVEVTVETNGHEHINQISRAMVEEGYEITRIY